MRNLNMSILNGELENETSLEDMHMFFVAFNKRQKRIVSGVEKDLWDANEVQEVMIVEGGGNGIDGQISSVLPITVTILEEEIELE